MRKSKASLEWDGQWNALQDVAKHFGGGSSRASATASGDLVGRNVQIAGPSQSTSRRRYGNAAASAYRGAGNQIGEEVNGFLDITEAGVFATRPLITCACRYIAGQLHGNMARRIAACCFPNDTYGDGHAAFSAERKAFGGH